MEFTKERYDELMMILDQTNNRPAGLRYPDWIFNFLNRVDEEILTMEAGGYLFKVYRYFAENRDQDCPLFINIHGGGWVVPHESCDSCYSAWIADHIQGVVLDIDYTTTTDAGWRTMFEQCCHVLEYAFQNAKSLGCDPEKICIGGYSAGGHLAAGVVLWSVERGYSVAGQVLCYAPLDLRIKKQIMPEDPIHRNMVLRGKAYQELLFRRETEIRDNPLVARFLLMGSGLRKCPGHW